MNKAEVIGFLKENPSFFSDNPEILEHVKAPEQKMGDGVVDFQNRMVNKLKTEKNKVLEIQKQIIENTQANIGNQARIHSAILALLEASSFEEFLDTIVQDFSILLDVDVTRLVLEAGGKRIPHIEKSGIRLSAPGIVERWIGDGDAVLQNDIIGNEEIFGSAAGLVRSEALFKLEIGGNITNGIMAFGSRDPDFFHADQEIDQVGFLAQVVERAFRIWLMLET